MLKIDEKAILIRINIGYPRSKTTKQLYDYTRGIWVIGKKREQVDFAFAVYQGQIKEVYAVQYWERVTPENYAVLDRPEPWHEDMRKRWLFVGDVDEEMSKKYTGKSVKEYFVPGNANPILYVNL